MPLQGSTLGYCDVTGHPFYLLTTLQLQDTLTEHTSGLHTNLLLQVQLRTSVLVQGTPWAAVLLQDTRNTVGRTFVLLCFYRAILWTLMCYRPHL